MPRNWAASELSGLKASITVWKSQEWRRRKSARHERQAREEGRKRQKWAKGTKVPREENEEGEWWGPGRKMEGALLLG